MTSSGRSSAAELTDDLVGARAQQRLGVGDAANAAADRERDREPLRDAADELDERAALLERRRDVEEHELVRAGVRVGAAELDRIADVAQADEVDALDDAAARARRGTGSDEGEAQGLQEARARRRRSSRDGTARR